MASYGMKQIVARGALAGLLAGVVAALVSVLIVERPMRAALVIEDARPAAPGARGGDLFSRPTQVVGGMVAAVVVAVLIGIVFAVVYRWVAERVHRQSAFARSLHLAAVGFAAIVLLPMVKYPGNPPGVGDPDTVDQRTNMYLSLIAAGLVLAVLAHWAYRALAKRNWPGPMRGVVAAGGAIVLAGVALAVWPANPDPIPPDVPAALLWQWRLASLFELAALWAALGVGFGLLVDSSARRWAAGQRAAVAPT